MYESNIFSGHRLLAHEHGRRKDFFQGVSHYGIFPKFFQGAKSGEICFFPLKTKKTTFFAKNFKI